MSVGEPRYFIARAKMNDDGRLAAKASTETLTSDIIIRTRGNLDSVLFLDEGISYP